MFALQKLIGITPPFRMPREIALGAGPKGPVRLLLKSKNTRFS